jgi:hypothetical protein
MHAHLTGKRVKFALFGSQLFFFSHVSPLVFKMVEMRLVKWSCC